MTHDTTTAATATTLAEQIDYAIQGCADSGIQFVARNAADLLKAVDDHEVAAQEIEELARLVRLAGASSAKAAV